MRQGNMLIDRRCCLRTAVAIRDLEIKRCDSMVAEGAFERRAAIHRFGCVISHIFNRSPSACPGDGAIGAQP
jgi:hypothetical protein